MCVCVCVCVISQQDITPKQSTPVQKGHGRCVLNPEAIPPISGKIPASRSCQRMTSDYAICAGRGKKPTTQGLQEKNDRQLGRHLYSNRRPTTHGVIARSKIFRVRHTHPNTLRELLPETKPEIFF